VCIWNFKERLPFGKTETLFGGLREQVLFNACAFCLAGGEGLKRALVFLWVLLAAGLLTYWGFNARVGGVEGTWRFVGLKQVEGTFDEFVDLAEAAFLNGNYTICFEAGGEYSASFDAESISSGSGGASVSVAVLSRGSYEVYGNEVIILYKSREVGRYRLLGDVLQSQPQNGVISIFSRIK